MNHTYRIGRTTIRLAYALTVSAAAFAFALTLPVQVSAFSVENLPEATVYNDFVVGPGKYQVQADPGETKTVNIIISNRLGKEKTFQIQIEDFTGSRDLQKPVVLLDSERGPYSLRDYIEIGTTTFTLGHAQRATIPVTVSVPTDAQPGGMYGSVVVSVATSPAEQVAPGASSVGVNPIITRIGSLFFVRVSGDVREDLSMKSFSLKGDKKILGSAPVTFQIVHENNGTVHQNPSGYVFVRNLMGSEVAKLEVEPWFVLPDSVRLREVVWDAPFLFGHYTATAEIARGYDNAKDVMTVSFWVIPWKIVATVFVGIVVVVFAVRWIASKVHISIKTK